MREKYESLALVDLKAIAKARGIKGTSTMKKAQVVEAMLLEDEKEKTAARETEPKKEPAAPAERKARAARTEVTAAEPGQETATAVRSTVRKPGTAAGAGVSAVSRQEESAKEPRNTGRSEYPRQSYNRPDNSRSDYANRSDSGRTEYRHDAAGHGESGRPDSGRNEYRHEGTGHTENSRPDNGRTEYARDTRSAEEVRGGEDSHSARSAEEGRPVRTNEESRFPADLDSGIMANGILEVMPDGYGFIRCENYLPGENDVYVAPSQIRRFNLKTGDILEGNTRVKTQSEKFSALLYVKSINGYPPDAATRRCNFEDMTPIFPDERLRLEMPGASIAMRIMDLISPVGKGQRGMIVSPPKAGKTTLLKEVAKSVKRNSPDIHLIILLIDERPEEVTDIKEAIEGPNVEVIYSTFDELPEHHKRVSEMVIERAKRLVEHKKDVMILLDSITRLTRAYNLTVPPSGRTLSGGLDPAALHMPKRFFGAARNMRGGGSLTILATALVETGSKMDDVVYEEFKGTGNMEMVLDRKLSERRVFPAIDIPKSGTRRDDLLLSTEEREAINIIRRGTNGMKPDEAVDRILDMFSRTRNNNEFVGMIKKIKPF